MSPDLRSRLDRITNLLFSGGLNNPVTYIEQISYLIYLKLLDEAENERELQTRLTGQHTSLFPQQAARYRWSQWRFFSGDKLLKFVRDEVFPYLGSLVREEPDVATYFQDARLQIEDPNVLKEVIDEIDHIAFARLGTDVKGDIFEYLLQYLATQEGALLGQFRSPRQIRKLMVEIVDPDLGDTIDDPACGTGGFIIDAIEHILAKYSSAPVEVPIYGEGWLEKEGVTLEEAKKKNPSLQTYRKGPGDLLPDWGQLEASLFGNDVSREMVRIARMNLVLHGFPRARLKRANTLSDVGGLTEDDLARRYRVVLSNPPFAGMLPRDSIRSDLPTNSKKSELLFLAVMMQSLAPGGRCAVVVPEGLLFGSTAAHTELRKKLVTDFEVQAVISLSAGVFKPYAGVKTSILVFRRPLQSGDATPSSRSLSDRRVWFYDLALDGYDADKISGGGRPQTPEKNDIPEFLQRWRDYKAGGFNHPWGPRGLQVLPADLPEPKSWWVTFEQIEQADWTLSPNQYKPQLAAVISNETPQKLLGEVIEAESRNTVDLQLLLKELSCFPYHFGDVQRFPKVKLHELGELDRGRSRHRPRNDPVLYGGLYPFIQTGDVTMSGGRITSHKQTYSDAGLAQSRLWPRGTLCITIAANIAETAVLDFDACFPDSIVGFNPRPGVSTEYVQAFIDSMRVQLAATAPQAAQKNINLDILRNLEVPLPPLMEQARFASQVAAIRRIRASATASATKLETLFQILLHRAFTGELTAKWREAHLREGVEEMTRVARS